MSKKPKFLTREQILEIPNQVKGFTNLHGLAETLGINDRTLDNHIKRLREAGHEVDLSHFPRGRKKIIL